MYFKANRIISVLLLYGVLYPVQAMEQKKPTENGNNTEAALQATQLKYIPSITQFSVLPEQCVTLRQGRDCFAEVNISWQSDSKQSLCLYQEGIEKHIVCWHEHDSADIAIDFVSNKNINYQLRNISDNKVVAETEIKVSWLHKSNARKRRWRLF